jgi:predicted HicB family RNase H-like nuclease
MSNKNILEGSLQLRISGNDRAELEQLAEAQGLSVSEVARRLLNAGIEGTTIRVRLPAPEHKKLHRIAKRRDISVDELVRRLLSKCLVDKLHDKV